MFEEAKTYFYYCISSQNIMFLEKGLLNFLQLLNFCYLLNDINEFVNVICTHNVQYYNKIHPTLSPNTVFIKFIKTLFFMNIKFEIFILQKSNDRNSIY